MWNMTSRPSDPRIWRAFRKSFWRTTVLECWPWLWSGSSWALDVAVAFEDSFLNFELSSVSHFCSGLGFSLAIRFWAARELHCRLNWKLVRPANSTWNFHSFQRIKKSKKNRLKAKAYLQRKNKHVIHHFSALKNLLGKSLEQRIVHPMCWKRFKILVRNLDLLGIWINIVNLRIWNLQIFEWIGTPTFFETKFHKAIWPIYIQNIGSAQKNLPRKFPKYKTYRKSAGI